MATLAYIAVASVFTHTPAIFAICGWAMLGLALLTRTSPGPWFSTWTLWGTAWCLLTPNTAGVLLWSVLNLGGLLTLLRGLRQAAAHASGPEPTAPLQQEPTHEPEPEHLDPPVRQHH